MTGQTVSHYELIEELASDRTGRLFSAQERVLGQTVQIKILNPDLLSDPDSFDRFSHEARSTSALNHKNVASILEVGRGPSGTAINDSRIFVVTRDPGGSTGDLIETTLRNPERAVEIARQIAEALSAVHELGLTHGALTPAGISVSEAGNVVVGDFGLSTLHEGRSLHPDDETYRAPEQRAGKSATRATDLWSLGALLYAMITGRPPLVNPGKDARRPVLLQGVSTELVDLVNHLLDPDPEKRPTSARSVVNAIHDVPEAADAQAKSVYVIPQSRSWSRMFLATILVFLIGTAAWFAVRRSSVPADRRVLAVAPFKVESASGLEFLATGSADVLTTSLDSVGGWRTVGADAVIGWAVGQPAMSDTDLAVRLADRFGAERVVTGSIRNEDGGNVFIATMYSRKGWVDGKIVVDAGSSEELPDALDELVRSVASELEINPAASSTRLSHSHLALKAYLEGTEAIRSGAAADAVHDFRSAVAHDPEFALAWSGLARAARLDQNHRLADEALGQAEERSGRLPPTTRTLLRARDLAFRRGDPEGAAQIYGAILRTDSTNVAALSELGETLYRYNPRLGLSELDAIPYFQRALANSPRQTVFAQRLSGISRDLDTGSNVDMETAATTALLAASNDSDPVSAFITLATEMEQMGVAEAFLLATEKAGRMQRYLPGSTDFLRSLVAAAEGRLSDHTNLTWRAGADYRGARLVSEVMLYAHTVYPASASKLEELRLRVSQWDTLAYPVHMLDDEDVFEGRYRILKPFLLALVSNRSGEDDTVTKALEELETFGALADGRLALSFAATIRALQADGNGDFESALDFIHKGELQESWAHMTKSQVYDQALSRYVKSELLFELGRYEESIRYSESLTVSRDFWGLAYLGPLRRRRAQAYALMGNTEQAIREYKLLMNLWSECDSDLVPQREEARVEMFRLLN